METEWPWQQLAFMEELNGREFGRKELINPINFYIIRKLIFRCFCSIINHIYKYYYYHYYFVPSKIVDKFYILKFTRWSSQVFTTFSSLSSYVADCPSRFLLGYIYIYIF